ncbi:hypothetical protein HDV05_007786, partial [Chytridiales sp. JEL 0842]
SLIIEEARASLKNPKRPVTPATWMARDAPPRRLKPLDAGTMSEDSWMDSESTGNFEGEDQQGLLDRTGTLSSVSSSTSPSRSPSRCVSAANSPSPADSTLQQSISTWSTLTQLLQTLTSTAPTPSTFQTLHTHLRSLAYLRQPNPNLLPPHPTGRRAFQKQKRDLVLESLLKCMHTHETSSLVAIGCSGLLLRLTRDQKVLSHVGRLLFKLSKKEGNDGVFEELRGCVVGGLVEVVEMLALMILDRKGETDGKESTEAVDEEGRVLKILDVLIYNLGTLKNLSSHSWAQDTILSSNGGPIFTRLLKMACIVSLKPSTTEKSTDDIAQKGLLERWTQLLIQLTLIIRNLAGSIYNPTHGNDPIQDTPPDTLLLNIFAQDWIPNLLSLITPGKFYTSSPELMLTISRALMGSQSSFDNAEEEEASAVSCVSDWVELMILYQFNKPSAHPPQPLISRVLFILGNLTQTLGPSHSALETSIDSIMALFDFYFECSKPHLSSSSSDGKEDIEVLTALIRLLANLNLHKPLSHSITQMLESENLVHLLSTLSTTVESSDSASTETVELLLNTLSALGNLTLHPSSESHLKPTHILNPLCSVILTFNTSTTSSEEILPESLRLLSNLTRLPTARQWMHSNPQGSGLLKVLLDHEESSIVCGVLGCFVNLLSSTDKGGLRDSMENAKILVGAERDGAQKLIELFEEFCAVGEWKFARVAGMVLGNLLKVEQVCRISGIVEVSEEKENWISIEEEETLGMLLLNIIDSTKTGNLVSQSSSATLNAEEENLELPDNVDFQALHSLALSLLDQLGYGGLETPSDDDDEGVGKMVKDVKRPKSVLVESGCGLD